MCYSKEVSLGVGVLVTAHTALVFVLYLAKDLFNNTVKKLSTDQWRFIAITTTSTFFLGLHQWMEYFAIDWESVLVYKIGLIFSISSMYFLMRGLEEITKSRFDSNLFLAIIAALSVQILFSPMKFENVHFYVRGHDHIIWGYCWLLLFFYWNGIAVVAGTKNGGSHKRFFTIYGICTLNLSFAIASTYAYAAAAYQNGFIQATCTAMGLDYVFSSFDVIKDAPSIWCVIHVVQVMVLPFMYSYYLRIFDGNHQGLEITKPDRIKVAVVTLAIVGLMTLTLTFFPSVGLKMFTK